MSRDMSRRIPSILVLLAAGAVSALLLWSRRDYVPIFDGRIYADCIARVATDLGDFPGYRCAGHIAESYVAITALAMRLAPGTSGALLVANALLLLAGAVALGRLMRSAFPDETHRLGRAMVVGAFLVHPVVLAAVVQPGLDLGLLVFSLCALAAAVEGRRWGLVLFGILLIFSKEPGVLLYGAIAAVWMWRRYADFMSPDDASRIGIAALVFLGFLSLIDAEVPSALFLLSAAAIVAHRPLRPALPPRKGLVRVALQDWPLAIPVLILVAYLVAYAMRSASGPDGAPGKPLVWGGGGGALALVDALLRGGVFDPPTRSSLALMFVVGFLWVPSLWTLADLVVGAIRHVRNAPPRPLPGVDRPALGFIVVVLIADVWLLSRFVTYSNARYYLPVFPLGLLAAYGALVRLRVPALPRAGLLASAAALLAVSTVRTVDPVSRAIWGTFQVGDRSLLSVTSLRKECCGHGRDQLAYNLEFTQFATLQDLLYERLKPQGGVLVVPEYGDWFVVERLDSATHRRTMRSDGSYVPTVLEAQKAQDLDAPTAWYVEMPYIKDTTFRAMLTKSYEFTEPCRVSHDGYALTAYTMRLRPKTLVSQSSAVRDRRCLPGVPSRPTPVLSIR